MQDDEIEKKFFDCCLALLRRYAQECGTGNEYMASFIEEAITVTALRKEAAAKPYGAPHFRALTAQDALEKTALQRKVPLPLVRAWLELTRTAVAGKRWYTVAEYVNEHSWCVEIVREHFSASAPPLLLQEGT